MNSIEFEILQLSYWEHFKLAKDLALVYPVEHKKRKTVEKILNELSDRMKKIKNDSFESGLQEN